MGAVEEANSKTALAAASKHHSVAAVEAAYYATVAEEMASRETAAGAEVAVVQAKVDAAAVQ